MARKSRATFAKREKERARQAKQAAKRARRHLTPDPSSIPMPEPVPTFSFGSDDGSDEMNVDEPGVDAAVEIDGGIDVGSIDELGPVADEPAASVDGSSE